MGPRQCIVIIIMIVIIKHFKVGDDMLMTIKKQYVDHSMGQDGAEMSGEILLQNIFFLWSKT